MKHINTFTWNRVFLVFNPSKEVIIKDFSLEDGERIFRKIYSEGKSNEKKNRMMGISSNDKLSGEFAKLIINHGYDEMSASSDEDSRNSVVKILNRISKDTALQLRHTSYTKYYPNSICRCGEWYFIIETCKYEEIAFDYSKEVVSCRGGERKGAGRKRVYEKLRFTETDLLMVPRYEKESLRSMLVWMIDRQAEGNSIKKLLDIAIRLMEEKADSTMDENDSKTIMEQASLLRDFRSQVPSFSIKEEYTSENP